MIAQKLFGIPSEEGLFEKAVNILKDDYGLIKDKLYHGNFQIFIWEDENQIGRWRVHCYKNWNWEIPQNGKNYDLFNFHYWLNNDKFNREILSKDPMKEPMQRVLDLSKNKFETNHMYFETSIDELEDRILHPEKYFEQFLKK